jgi:hypothetical protein
VTRLQLPKRPRIGDSITIDGREARILALWPGTLVLDDGTRRPWRLAPPPDDDAWRVM